MKFVKPICLAVGMIGLLTAPVMEAWGRGSPGGAPASCLVKNPGPSGKAIRGTMTLEVTSNVGSTGTQDGDFTLRLTGSSGVQQFFRVHVVAAFAGLSDEEIVCRIFDDVANQADPAVVTFVQQVRSGLGLAASAKFVITNKSISASEALDADLLIPGTVHASSMADITIYAQ